MKTVGIIGGTGYTAGELLRILIHHPEIEIDFVYSHSKAGALIASVHDDLFDLKPSHFVGEVNLSVDVVFLCLGHGNSMAFLTQYHFSKDTVVIDLSNDFRLKTNADFLDKNFVYGLPELYKEKIQNSRYIANPGCFATAIQLALLPLAKGQFLSSDVHVHGITGSTGAGATPSDTTHFSWRNNNLSVYKALSHQHLGEIGEQVSFLQSGFNGSINFIPVRGDFTRGILTTMYTETDLSETDLLDLFCSFYQGQTFVKVSNRPIHLKQVVNTNFGLLQVQKIQGKALVTSVIDNLLKGASGQAVQNMNLIFGFDEQLGLNFKANFF